MRACIMWLKFCVDWVFPFYFPGQKGFKHRTDTGYYGRGAYFSEFPGFSIGYIQGATKLMLCQILTGKVMPSFVYRACQ